MQLHRSPGTSGWGGGGINEGVQRWKGEKLQTMRSAGERSWNGKKKMDGPLNDFVLTHGAVRIRRVGVLESGMWLRRKKISGVEEKSRYVGPVLVWATTR